MNPPRIRPATEADLAELGKRLAPLPLFSAYGLGPDALARRWTDGLRKGDGLLVAEVGDALLGLCWFLREGTFANGAYLRTLAVAPGEQSQGIGAVLLGGFEDACGKPSGGWFLLASDFNDGAHRFYQRHGYIEVGRLPGFAKPDIVERIFWKRPQPVQGP